MLKNFQKFEFDLTFPSGESKTVEQKTSLKPKNNVSPTNQAIKKIKQRIKNNEFGDVKACKLKTRSHKDSFINNEVRLNFKITRKKIEL